MKQIKLIIASLSMATVVSLNAQTNVFDDIIAASPNHTYLEAALIQEGLDTVLQNAPAVTVFAPEDAAFDNLATALGTNISGLLALPNLSDILLYHVVGSSVPSSAVTNGAIVNAVSTTNTLKLTKTSTNMVYANHAMVTTADLTAANGYVHSINAVLLPSETVVDIAIDNGFTSLTAAVVRAELLPALTNPLATYTVFAPTNQAFTDLATALGTDLNGVLANPNLTDILLYHVIDTTLLAANLTNGPLTTLEGGSVNVALGTSVTINTATVTIPDLTAGNGVVHVINQVLLPANLSVEEVSGIEINMYPNPASDFITIDSKEYQFEEIMIFDMNGRLVMQNSLSNSGSNLINISAIPDGNYFIELRNKNQVARKKIMVF